MIAVLGANGQLGTALKSLLGEEALAVTRNELDLSQLDSVPRWVDRFKPEVIVNCAAYTAVDAAESDVETARVVNALAVGALAESAARAGARLITFSTDYVFDGEKDGPYLEDDPPNPVSVYGQTKLEGEHLARERGDDVLIIRTSWVLSGTHRNFAATMLQLLRKGQVDVVTDQKGRPTIAADLATSVVQCLDQEVTGLLHLTNQGTTTWFALAREIARLAGLDPGMVRPTTTEEFQRPAHRPANSALESTRLSDLGVSPLPHHLESLPTLVDELTRLGF